LASWRKQRDGKARRGGVSWHYTTHIHIHTYVHTHTPPAHLQIEPARQHHINRRGKQDPRPVQNHPERVALVQYEGEHPGEENGPEPGPPWTAEADADEVVFDDDGEDGDAGEDRRGGEQIPGEIRDVVSQYRETETGGGGWGATKKEGTVTNT
jgi:hypothetical protein